METLYLPQSHTGTSIAKVLESILEFWGLKSEQQICITTDNGSNMVAAITNLGWTHLSCFGQNLNLAVTNSMKGEGRITQAVGVCKKVVQYLHIVGKKEVALLRHKLQKGYLITLLSPIDLLGGDHNTR